MKSIYKPVGWRNESHRHYLAAKGIKTRLKYNADKLSFTEFVNNVKGDEGPEKHARNCVVCHKPAYMAAKESMCAVCKSKVYGHKPGHDRFYAMKEPLKDDRPFYHEHKMDAVGVNLRQRDVDNMQNEVVGKLDSAMREDMLTGENRERFIKNEFKTASEDYINGRIDKSTYDDEVRRKLNSHLTLHAKRASAFDWAKEKEVAK